MKPPSHTPTPDGVLTLSENAQDVYVPGIKGTDGTGAWLSRFDIARAVSSRKELLMALATMIDGYRTLASSVEEKEVWLTNPGVVRAIETFQAIAKAECK